MQFAVTGPGKLTVGKLYGGILIYEIWKTTRFSNLEILAKVTTITKCICIASTSSSWAIQQGQLSHWLLTRWKRRWRASWRKREPAWRELWRRKTCLNRWELSNPFLLIRFDHLGGAVDRRRWACHEGGGQGGVRPVQRRSDFQQQTTRILQPEVCQDLTNQLFSFLFSDLEVWGTEGVLISSNSILVSSSCTRSSPPWSSNSSNNSSMFRCRSSAASRSRSTRGWTWTSSGLTRLSLREGRLPFSNHILPLLALFKLNSGQILVFVNIASPWSSHYCTTLRLLDGTSDYC